MEGSPLIDAALTEAIWVLGAGLLGLVATIACLVGLLSRKPVPLLASGAGLGVMALAAIGGGLGGLFNPDLYTGTLASGMVHMLAGFAAVPLCGITLLGTCALALSGERDWKLPVVAGGFVALIVAVTWLEGSYGGNTRFGVVRAVLFAGMGALTTLSLVRSDAGGRDGAGLAAVCFALLVALVESAERGMAASMGLLYTVDIVGFDKRPESIAKMAEHVAPALPWTWAAVALAALLAVLVVVTHAVRHGVRPLELAGLGWVLLAPAVLTVGMPSEDDLVAAAAQAPPPKAEREPGAPPSDEDPGGG